MADCLVYHNFSPVFWSFNNISHLPNTLFNVDSISFFAGWGYHGAHGMYVRVQCNLIKIP